MKTPGWFTRNRALSHLRIATAVTLTSSSTTPNRASGQVPAKAHVCNSGTPQRIAAGDVSPRSKWGLRSYGPTAPSSTLGQTLAVQVIPRSTTRIPGPGPPGPDFPDSLDIADGPAALEPNGKVLMMTSPTIFNTPATFFEWDGSSLTEISPAFNASNDSSFYGNMLVLPTGQILFTDFFFVSVYNPTGTYNPAWAPGIQSAPATVSPGGSYVISGHGFNGMSQGAAYGDDQQSATNYPLVRITNNATGHVFYSRTHDHSSMAVASGALVSTHFDVPTTQEPGPSQLVVVANGIPSAPVAVTVN
jgi:hypothetical protein